MFRSLLVANRGEIAVRVIRACREMGIRSVAVYSEADRLSPHVLAADEAYCVGPPPSSESYLRIDRIMDVARRAGADAVHPGYGFLAERAPFARAVEEAGLVFVGPSADTIEAMGDKTEARRRMRAAGVPIVPGLVEPLSDPEEAAVAAESVGFPVLLKASAGGGGKGMRIVRSSQDLRRSFEAASREASAAFGNGSIYLEKFLDAPRHIEIQILGDMAGNLVYLGERECSVQRRHQKLIEEAPSPVVTPDLREAMGQTAVRAARAADYHGAGTVEFLYENGEFFFLEMNTRLQVEHPVTELIMGLDLVHWQIQVAAGESLAFRQEDLKVQGHAIECRITSEDPFRGFLPSVGEVELLDIPAGPGIRWDGGIMEGFKVGLHYDPLLAKLIVHGPTRDQAICRMKRALDELIVAGVATSAPFHRRVMDEPDFRAGRLSIRYVEDHPHLLANPVEDGVVRTAAVTAALLEDAERRTQRTPRLLGSGRPTFSAWRSSGWPWNTGM